MSAILALLAVCASAHAQGLLQRYEAPSPTLGRTFPYFVYLPEGYAESGLSYPVLYLLHGAGGDEADWDRQGSIKETADRMIAARAIPPAIIVMPGCPGCWWVDGRQDKAETAFWSDLVPAVSSRYRVLTTKRNLVLAGISAGGFGAVRYALRYPDRVAAVAALSPAVYADLPPAESAARTQPAFLKQDGTFDAASWKAKNYPSLIGQFASRPTGMPFYLASGDSDRLGITFETIALFKQLYTRQPELTELRIVDGDHTWGCWKSAMEGAMRYLLRHADPPAPSTRESSQIAAKLPPTQRAVPLYP